VFRKCIVVVIEDLGFIDGLLELGQSYASLILDVYQKTIIVLQTIYLPCVIILYELFVAILFVSILYVLFFGEIHLVYTVCVYLVYLVLW
jgi:hypothetical protein